MPLNVDIEALIIKVLNNYALMIYEMQMSKPFWYQQKTCIIDKGSKNILLVYYVGNFDNRDIIGFAINLRYVLHQIATMNGNTKGQASI